mmetsp:Transcript_6284/g.18444  ORF Transcript_6284/g.18444 Transcript_6284/m.18444 type:complete len:214 (+) Transcript_6284:453-1094(+)
MHKPRLLKRGVVRHGDCRPVRRQGNESHVVPCALHDGDVLTQLGPMGMRLVRAFKVLIARLALDKAKNPPRKHLTGRPNGKDIAIFGSSQFNGSDTIAQGHIRHSLVPLGPVLGQVVNTKKGSSQHPHPDDAQPRPVAAEGNCLSEELHGLILVREDLPAHPVLPLPPHAGPLPWGARVVLQDVGRTLKQVTELGALRYDHPVCRELWIGTEA